jgi:hypothetical protein
MKGSALIVFALAIGFAAGPGSASAQAPVCQDFMKLRDEAQKKGEAIAAGQKRKVDRKEMCALVTRFVAAEGAAVKFLEANKTWCGVPDEAVKGAKATHAKTVKFRDMVCAEAPEPHPKVPTLSDALGSPTLDTSKNTRTGHGTFDTLNGNPLAR